MYITNESERSLGAFVLISLILHALLIFLYPQWELAMGPGLLLGGNGGGVTIIPIESEQPSPQAQLSRQPAQGVPSTEKKVPAAEVAEPKPEVKPEPEAKPPTAEAKTPPTPPEPERATAIEKEVVPKPVQQESTKPVAETEQSMAESGTNDNDTLLTSEQGQEVVVSGGDSPRESTGKGSEAPSVEQGTAEEVQPSPPPLPPLPAAGSIVAGGGRVQYPKNAINEGVAGTVKLDAYVPKGATRANRIVIRESSGAQNLDQVARLTVQNGWKMEPLLEDYVLSVTIVFSGPPGFKVSIQYDGIQYVRSDQTGN